MVGLAFAGSIGMTLIILACALPQYQWVTLKIVECVRVRVLYHFCPQTMVAILCRSLLCAVSVSDTVGKTIHAEFIVWHNAMLWIVHFSDNGLRYQQFCAADCTRSNWNRKFFVLAVCWLRRGHAMLSLSTFFVVVVCYRYFGALVTLPCAVMLSCT